MEFHDTTAIIIKQNNKFLISQRKKPPHKGMWGFPGGHVDKNESIKKGAQREAQEEIGNVEIKEKIMEFVHDVQVGHKHNCHAFTAIPKQKLKAMSDVAEIKWVTLEEMKNYEMMEWALHIVNEKFLE